MCWWREGRTARSHTAAAAGVGPGCRPVEGTGEGSVGAMETSWRAESRERQGCRSGRHREERRKLSQVGGEVPPRSPARVAGGAALRDGSTGKGLERGGGVFHLGGKGRMLVPVPNLGRRAVSLCEPRLPCHVLIPLQCTPFPAPVARRPPVMSQVPP